MSRKTFTFEILLIAVALTATWAAWPHLPELIPTHWDLDGQADHVGPRWAIILIGPGSMAAIMLLTWLLPWLAPKNFQIEAFQPTYHTVMRVAFCMMAYFFAAQLWAALGHPTDAVGAILGGACLFTALIGNLMGKVRRNFFIGIRTPWTLSNEHVWNATHRFAGRTMVAGGLAGLVLTICGLHPWAIFCLLAGTLAPVMYSLVIYKQLERRGAL